MTDMLRTYVVRALTIAAIVVVLALAAGALLGQPVFLSFVTSESMSPTIQEGDGFVAIPDLLAGDVREGDVVVFEAQEIEGGGLTTHRVVGETDEGYITRGDGNPFTDQDGAEPPVTDDQIVATAWQPGGQVVTIPALGTAVTGARALVFDVQATIAAVLGFEGADDSRQIGSVLLVAGLGLLVVTVGDTLLGRASRSRIRSGIENAWLDPRYAAIFLVAIVVVPANAAMVLPSTTHQVPIDGDAFADEVEPGEQTEVGLSATNDGLVTMLVVFDPPSGTTLDDQRLGVPGSDTASTTMYVPAPPPGEQRTVGVSENRYVLLFPPSLLVSLHEIHPLVALGTINLALTVTILAVVFGLVGARKRRTRVTGRDVPLSLRLRRMLR